MNKWNDKKDRDLAAIARNAGATLLQHPDLGVAVPIATALMGSGTSLNGMLDDAQNARDLAAAATLAKDAQRERAIEHLNQVAAIVYSNPELTPDQIRSLGFSPRNAGRSQPKLPTTVTGLKVKFAASGAPVVSFARGDNRESTIFLIQTSLDAGATWTTAMCSLRTRETLPELSSASPALVRVVATNALGEAAPSTPVALASPLASASALRVVAGGKAA